MQGGEGQVHAVERLAEPERAVIKAAGLGVFERERKIGHGAQGAPDAENHRLRQHNRGERGHEGEARRQFEGERGEETDPQEEPQRGEELREDVREPAEADEPERGREEDQAEGKKDA